MEQHHLFRRKTAPKVNKSLFKSILRTYPPEEPFFGETSAVVVLNFKFSDSTVYFPLNVTAIEALC